MSTSNIGLKQASSRPSHKESAALGTTDSGVWCLGTRRRGWRSSVSAALGREGPGFLRFGSVGAQGDRQSQPLRALLRSGCVRARGGHPPPPPPFWLCQGVRGAPCALRSHSGHEGVGARGGLTIPHLLRSGCVRARGEHPAPFVPNRGVRVQHYSILGNPPLSYN